MPLPRIKICGITAMAPMQIACACGAAAIGFVFAAGKRQIAPDNAAAIGAAMPPFVARVGVFAAADEQQVLTVLAACELDYLQFHGGIPPRFRTTAPRPIIEAIGIDKNFHITQLASPAPSVCAYLFDAKIAGKHGGTGATFPWDKLDPSAITKPFLIAGGLAANNVGAALRRFTPYGLDVSSGVEDAPGVKSSVRMRAFFAAAGYPV